MDKSNFNNWIIGKPDWKEIQYQYQTGAAYQHKQDLRAIFWNSYVYYQQKFEIYFNEYQSIPYQVFDDLIFEFRQSFPKSGRTLGINYFDDLIELLVKRYEDFPQANNAGGNGPNVVTLEELNAQLNAVNEEMEQIYVELTGHRYNDELTKMPFRVKNAIVSKDARFAKLLVRRDELKKEQTGHQDFKYGHLGTTKLSYDFLDSANYHNWTVKLNRLKGPDLRPFIRYHAEKATVPLDELAVSLKDFVSLSTISEQRKAIILDEIEGIKNKSLSTGAQSASHLPTMAIKIRPIFKDETIEQIFGLLKGYFSPEDQTQLKRLLTSGTITGAPLIFL